MARLISAPSTRVAQVENNYLGNSLEISAIPLPYPAVRTSTYPRLKEITPPVSTAESLNTIPGRMQLAMTRAGFPSYLVQTHVIHPPI